MIDVKKLASLAEITISIEPEDFDPIESFGYDTEAENQEAAAFVRALAERTEWGWCRVTVRAAYGSVTGYDSLGGCSYESERDFKACGYYEDMRREALADLASQLASIDGDLRMVRL